MLIGLEASRANRPHRTGVEWYAAQLFRALHELPLASPHAWKLYTDRPLQEDLRAWTRGWHEDVLSWPPRYAWTQLRLSWEMRFFPPDVLFVPAHVLPQVLPRRAVVTVHDIGFHRFPQAYKPIQIAYHEMTTRDIRSSRAEVLTVSSFCKQELVEAYGFAPERITVTPLGVDATRYKACSIEERDAVREKYALGKRSFLLYVGRLEEKKNVAQLLEAFFRVAETDHELDLVLVGLPGYGWSKMEQRLKTHPLGKRVRVLGYVDEQDKPALIASAEALLLLSLYEGFGLPVLEAMACETPVICSHTSSLPEVAGGHAYKLVDPSSLEDAVEAIRALRKSSQETRAHLTKKARVYAETFTWKRTAEQTLRVLTGYAD